jgi:hypothetical protein
MGNVKTQQCRICGAVQPLAAPICAICGARLPGQPSTVIVPVEPAQGAEKQAPRQRYDPAQGDDDLYAGDLSGRFMRILVGIGIGAALLLGVGIGVGVMALGDDGGDPEAQVESLQGKDPTAPPTSTPRDTLEAPVMLPSRTARPTLAFATITPAPPTPSETPEPGPCVQTAQAGDTVYGMAIRCGHQDMAVVEVILEANDMDDATELKEGQTLEIPWPTPTPGGETPTPPAEPSGAEGEGETSPDATEAVSYNEFGTPDAMAKYQGIEATLRPGLAWHTIQSGETAVSIAQIYGTTLETLSQINPQIQFLQCDYSSAVGGPNCSVLLAPGDRMRVPVPLPTPTFTPSPAGSLTPTPTPTATFNAPYPHSPEEGRHFFADEEVTVRWGGTGTLGPDERYLVRVKDLNVGDEYMVALRDDTYKLPHGWQPSDGKRHTFEWTISVVVLDAANNVLAESHVTIPRQFTWDSR